MVLVFVATARQTTTFALTWTRWRWRIKPPSVVSGFCEGSHTKLIIGVSGARRGSPGAGMDLLFPSNLCQGRLD